MPDWAKILHDLHAVAHGDDELTLATQPGAGDDELDRLADRLGIALPEEFRDFYRTFNGYGVAPDNDPSDVCWLIQPLEKLPDFIDFTRSSFDGTHPDVAARFFPFIDWANGDGMGYLTETAGIVLPGLFCFEHESYEYDANQDPDEFIAAIPVTIEEFLSLG